MRIEALAYLPGAAFQVAAASLAGQFLGAGDQRRAARSVLITLLFGGGLMTAAGVFMWLAADPLVKLFVGADKLEIVAEAAPLLRIVSWTMPALATMTILAGALRGAGDTRVPFLFTIVGLLGVRIPCAYLLTQYFEFGVQGAWYAMVADIFVRCRWCCSASGKEVGSGSKCEAIFDFGFSIAGDGGGWILGFRFWFDRGKAGDDGGVASSVWEDAGVDARAFSISGSEASCR